MQMTGRMDLQDHPYHPMQKLLLPLGACGGRGGRNTGYGTVGMRTMTAIGVTMAGGSLTWIGTQQALQQI